MLAPELNDQIKEFMKANSFKKIDFYKWVVKTNLIFKGDFTPMILLEKDYICWLLIKFPTLKDRPLTVFLNTRVVGKRLDLPPGELGWLIELDLSFMENYLLLPA